MKDPVTETYRLEVKYVVKGDAIYWSKKYCYGTSW